MSSRFPSRARHRLRAHGAAWLCVALALVFAAGCERETRRFDPKPVPSDLRTQPQSLPDLQPGQPGPGMRETASAGRYDEKSAYEVAQGKMLFRWYNCSGCHAQGGGNMGPALMDTSWIYGSDPDSVFSTIMDGRPRGMPSFRGRIPEAQVWELVAYVRSMSGLIPNEAAPNRDEGLGGAPPESMRKPQPPKDSDAKVGG
ncbi:MAG TPA: c-type cytochrome [Usitatibacter sp.]|nr:c-type cytochrome [Usitatibacter sp.]